MLKSSQIARVAVIGAGTLGAQIAAMAAASGRTVLLYDAMPGAADAALDRLRSLLDPVIAEGDLAWDLDEVLSRIQSVATLAESVTDADLAIEAVREEPETKRSVFRQIGEINPHLLLATNSSSIASSQLADAVADPGKFVNMHFFSSFWDRAMVELMSCGQTTPETMAILEAFGNSLGLFMAIVNGDSKGFIINRIWRAVKRESLRVVDEGVADAGTVDRLWAMFWGSELGPFGMMDEVGLNVVADIEESYIATSLDPTDVTNQTLQRMVNAGDLGRKSGQGFYSYPHPAYEAPGWPCRSRNDSPGQPESHLKENDPGND